MLIADNDLGNKNELWVKLIAGSGNVTGNTVQPSEEDQEGKESEEDHWIRSH